MDLIARLASVVCGGDIYQILEKSIDVPLHDSRVEEEFEWA